MLFVNYLSICLKISKVHGNWLVVSCSFVMCTAYTNKFRFGQLKLRFGPLLRRIWLLSKAEKMQCDDVLNMADQITILVIVGETKKMCFSCAS